MKSFFVLLFGDGFEILENGTSKLVVGLKISSRQMQFKVVKQPEVTGREIWAVRWMLKLHNPQRIQRILHKPSFMGPSIIVKNSQAFTDGTWAPLFIVLFYCSKTGSDITLANNIFLADKLRLFLKYFGVTEFENGTSSGQLALLFVIL